MGNCGSTSCSKRCRKCLVDCFCCECDCFGDSETGRSSSYSSSDKITANPMTMAPLTSTDETDSSSPAALNVRTFDYCLEANGRDHHTEKYDAMNRNANIGLSSNLVARRGQPFRVIISFNRPFDSQRDAISFIFTLQDIDKPNHGHGTLVAAALKYDSFNLGEPIEWICAIDAKYNNYLEILIKPAATAPIGEWKFDIDTQLINGGGAATYKSPSSFYLLFNPWCTDDVVYMADNSEREEYVLTDSTLIWRGSYNRMRPSIWQLGQFERNVLECSLLLLATVGRVAPAFRGDPVKISRALSAMVNSNDDQGAVQGNWSDDFSGGTAPTKWVGSVEILQEYYKKRKPVKFGQCWVFAGTLTTIARAIGLPSRIITCYSCAHDTQASLTVDYFVDEKGKIMEELNSDSIWNYHVWNEIWMERPDLGSNSYGYHGWQAVDATPQEMSDGTYRCGPAPIRAVKYGEIQRPYDCNFLFAEVNADKLFWRYTGPYQPLKLLRTDTLAIGQLISTKAVGRWEREDITNSYKFPEKTRDERDTMLKALKQSNSAFSRFYLNEEFNDVTFTFDLLDDIKVGETFFVTLQIKNRSVDESYFVSGTLHLDSIHYTGKNREEVKSTKFQQNLPPNSVQLIEMEVTYYDYQKKLSDQGAFNISCMAKVHETDYDFFAQDDFRVRKPDIKISLQNKPEVDRETDVIVRLTNPLPIPLKNGTFQVEGGGIQRQLHFKIPEIPVDGTGSATFKFTPQHAGRSTIAAKFYSKELNDVDGFLAFEVQPRPEDIYYNGNYRPSEYIVRTNIIP